MTQYFLGVDIGATKSHALIADEGGQALGLGVGGPGNWEVVGWEGTHTVLDQILDRATAQVGIKRDEIFAAGLGLAGYDWPEDGPPYQAIVHQLLRPDLPVALVNDALIGLWAGTDTGWGVVVVAGTSCNCYGRNAQGEIGRGVGSSYFGEYAGAGELVWWAVQAVAHAWARRGPDTQLSEALVAAAGARDVTDLLTGLMRDRYSLSACHAPLVFDVAAGGDPVTLDLVRRAGHELGKLALGVSCQIGLTSLAFDVVLSGSFYKGSPLIQESMAKTIRSAAPQARLARLAAPPVVGAVLLGMEQAGFDYQAIRQDLIASTNSLPKTE